MNDYTLKKGTSLRNGKYRIEKVLGQGSFGITYLASTRIAAQGELGKMEITVKVAVKEFFMGDVNRRGVDGSSVRGSSGNVFTSYRKKFRKEAENLSKLSHPDIVRVFDVFDENDTTYYVMEYLNGDNLDDYIKQKGQIPEAEALRIMREIGSAVGYMHSRKMLHLDVKPKNVMRQRDGANKLIDFGLSKQYDEQGEPESSTSIGLGTPGYSPIEQASYRQDGTFPATLDVYALGATLFKMLCGQRPADATIILNEGFPQEKLRSHGITEKTIKAVEKAMSPIKKNRFQTIREFLGALEIAEPVDTGTFEDDTEATAFEEDIEVEVVSQPASASKKVSPEPAAGPPKARSAKAPSRSSADSKSGSGNRNWTRFLTVSGIAIVALIVAWIAIYSPQRSVLYEYEYANDSVYVADEWEEPVVEEAVVAEAPDSIFYYDVTEGAPAAVD